MPILNVNLEYLFGMFILNVYFECLFWMYILNAYSEYLFCMQIGDFDKDDSSRPLWYK